MEDAENHELKVQEKKAQEVLATLPEEEKQLMTSVLELQKKRTDVYLEYLQELRQLENKYEAKYAPIFQERANLVREKPRYWLKVLKNNELSSSFVYDTDEPLLNHLVDIRYTSDPNIDSFTLEFEFSENPYIANTVLTKKYTLNGEKMNKAEGCEIEWKGENLTQKVTKVKKKGRNKGTKTKVVPSESFFNFFKSREGADEDSEDELEADMLTEEDFDLGTEFRDEIIPNSVLYYLNVRSDSDEENDETPQRMQVNGEGSQKPDCKNQ